MSRPASDSEIIQQFQKTLKKNSQLSVLMDKKTDKTTLEIIKKGGEKTLYPIEDLQYNVKTKPLDKNKIKKQENRYINRHPELKEWVKTHTNLDKLFL